MASRDVQRLIYELAFNAAANPTTKQMIFQAGQDQEQQWAAIDRVTAQREQQAQQAAATQAQAAPSAVEKHGVDSPEAEAKQGAKGEGAEAAVAPEVGIATMEDKPTKSRG